MILLKCILRVDNLELGETHTYEYKSIVGMSGYKSCLVLVNRIHVLPLLLGIELYIVTSRGLLKVPQVPNI